VAHGFHYLVDFPKLDPIWVEIAYNLYTDAKHTGW